MQGSMMSIANGNSAQGNELLQILGTFTRKGRSKKGFKTAPEVLLTLTGLKCYGRGHGKG